MNNLKKCKFNDAVALAAAVVVYCGEKNVAFLIMMIIANEPLSFSLSVFCFKSLFLHLPFYSQEEENLI